MHIFMIRRGKQKLTVLVIFLLVLILGLFFSLRGRAQPDDVTAGRVLPIYGTDDDQMRLSVTFNCAWGAQDIPDILQILRQYNVRATFFVVGTWAEKYPEAVKMIHDAGHDLGNHSYSHQLPSHSTEAQLENEIRRCNEIVEQITGEKPILYRAPSGDYTETVVRLANRMGMAAIKWTADSVDWKQDVSKQALINRILNGAASGGILLFHNDTQHTVAALPEILERLTGRGFKFVPVSELIYQENYVINSQGIQVKKH